MPNRNREYENKIQSILEDRLDEIIELTRRGKDFESGSTVPVVKLNHLTPEQAKQALQLYIKEQVDAARESAKQELREKFHIDANKNYQVMGTENAVIIVEEKHAKKLKSQLKGEK